MLKLRIGLLSGALATSVILITGCGGGGGGGDSSPPPAAGGAIAGVAAKGILQDATVTAYCGNSEAAADKLASGDTDADGKYSVKWTTACTKPLRLKVTPKTTTKMKDEATGTDVTPPADFSMSALVPDPSTTTEKHITPFTDMAAAVAGTATTKAAIQNAELAVISTVLGGDINTYKAKPVLPTAASLATANSDEKKMATLLTAVSALAQDDATCKALANDGLRIACSMKKLKDQAKATCTSVTDKDYTVNAAPTGGTPASLLATTLAKVQDPTNPLGISTSTDVETMKGSGADTLVQVTLTDGTKTIDVTSQSGVQAARDWLNSLKNDLLSLSDSSGNGFLDQKAKAAQADWATNGQLDVGGIMDFMAAVNRGSTMASEVKTWPAPPTGLAANAAYPVFGNTAVVSGSPNAQTNTVLVTDSSGNANAYIRYFATFERNGQPLSMNCRVLVSEMTLGKARCSYPYGKASTSNTSAGTVTNYFHLVKVSETATSGGFTWEESFSTRDYSSSVFYTTPGGSIFVPSFVTSFGQTFLSQRLYTSFAVPAAAAVDGPLLTGAAGMTTDSTGNPTGLSLKGDFHPFDPASAPDKISVDVNASLSATSTANTVNLTGTVAASKAGATVVSMSLASGSQLVAVPATTTSPEKPVSANLIVQMKTAAFQYDGTISMDTFTADKAGNYLPGNSSFTGKVSTLSSGTATEFMSGTLGAKLTNIATFDPAQPDSSTNFMGATGTFNGKVTTSTTTYAVTLIVDGSTFNQESITLNYTRNGTQLVSVTGSHSATGSTLTIKGTGDLTVSVASGSTGGTTGAVSSGTTSIGSISKGRCDFNDGTYVLLGV